RGRRRPAPVRPGLRPRRVGHHRGVRADRDAVGAGAAGLRGAGARDRLSHRRRVLLRWGHGLRLGARRADRAGGRWLRCRRGAPGPPAGGPVVTDDAAGRTELPVADTVDVRSGPEVAEALLSVLPLLGEWHGEGVLAGGDRDRRFGQWVRFSHDGRDFLAYESRTWLLTDDGAVT